MDSPQVVAFPAYSPMPFGDFLQLVKTFPSELSYSFARDTVTIKLVEAQQTKSYRLVDGWCPAVVKTQPDTEIISEEKKSTAKKVALRWTERTIIKVGDEFIYIGFISEGEFYPEPPLRSLFGNIVFPTCGVFARSLDDGIYADLSDPDDPAWISVVNHVVTRQTTLEKRNHQFAHWTNHNGHSHTLVNSSIAVPGHTTTIVFRDRTHVSAVVIGNTVMSSSFASWCDTNNHLRHTMHGQSSFNSGPIKINSLWQFGTPVRYDCVYTTNDIKDGKPRRATGIPSVPHFSDLSAGFSKRNCWTVIESSQQMHWLELDNECIVTSKPGRFILRGSLAFIREMIRQRYVHR